MPGAIVRRLTRRSISVAVIVVGGVLAGPSTAGAVAPAAPQLLTPADGAVFGLLDIQRFTIRVADADGDSVVGLINVQNLDTGRAFTFATAPAGPGEPAGALATPPLTPGRYAWHARATDTSGATGAASVTRTFAVGPNGAPAVPALLVPASGAVLHRVGNEPFAISATDPNGDVYTGTITIRNGAGSVVAELFTTPTQSGNTASALLVQPLEAGNYTWTARVVDVHGAPSPISANSSFSVIGPPGTGTGLATGRFGYDGVGVAPGSCAPRGFDVDLDAATVVFNSAIVGYLGPFTLTGRGASPCESVASGSGTFSLNGSGTNDEGSLVCPTLDGTYSRVGVALEATLVGPCWVNNFHAGRVTIVLSGVAVLEPVGSGLWDPVTSASVAAALAIVPE